MLSAAECQRLACRHRDPRRHLESAETAEAAGSSAHEVVRIEQVGEAAVAMPGDYAENFRELLTSRMTTAVATKSIIAYRTGFDGDLSDPPPSEVAAAAAHWLDSGEGG